MISLASRLVERRTVRFVLSVNHACLRCMIQLLQVLVYHITTCPGCACSIPFPHPAGLTTWLPLAAQELLSSATAPPPKCPPSSSASSSPAAAVAEAVVSTNRTQSRALLQEGLVAVWDQCSTAWLNVGFPGDGSRRSRSSSRSCRGRVAAAAWLNPSVQQLADKLLWRPMVSIAPGVALRALMSGGLQGTSKPTVHPQLVAAAGQTPDPALAAQVAAAMQQVGIGCGSSHRGAVSACQCRASEAE
jgi:hypothetical protein